MEKVNFYKYLSGLFLIINIALLVFMFLFHPSENGRKGSLPQEILKLDENQMEQFHQILIQHIEEIKPLNAIQKSLVLKVIERSSEPLNVNLADSLNQKYNQISSQKFELKMAHFIKIKSILKKDQLANFDKFMNEIFKNQEGPREPKKRKRQH